MFKKVLTKKVEEDLGPINAILLIKVMEAYYKEEIQAVIIDPKFVKYFVPFYITPP